MKTTHHDIDLKSRHVTPADGNVFADLGFSPKEAKALLKNADARIASLILRCAMHQRTRSP
jgi:hypothetical protein